MVDMKRKYDVKTTSVNSISSLLAAFAERLQPHGLGGQGEAPLIVLDDVVDRLAGVGVVGGVVVGDDLDLVGDDLAVVVDALNGNDDDVHVVLLSTSSRRMPPASVWRASYV